MYSDEELSALYPHDYYAYQEFQASATWKKLAKKMLGCKVATKDPDFSSAGIMLDIGCGTGWSLIPWRDAGWKVHGVEISQTAAELGRDNENIDIFPGTVQEAKFGSHSFDYIRMNHSFEHMSRPDQVLNEVYRILKDSGILLIGVPNLDSFNAKLFGANWWYLGAPVHTFTYSVATLSALLRKSGFIVQKVNFNSDGFGVVGSLQILCNRTSGRRSSEGRFINSVALKVIGHWIAKVFDLLKRGDCIEVIAVKDNGAV